uniref:Uncharacterized protein LOC100180848 n=1 Tax=Phallusia mammillata TaxID=59560 RepID=A0A6F9DHI4_9ASCI|nr:uncharacterized protein LOC100180848 [Phallusia mammillata]
MKVIAAGVSKTGTKSMAEALRILGLTVHDSMEHYKYHRQVWYDYIDGKATLDDIRESYKGVDAVTDFPVHIFWEQLAEAFPEAKIILTQRDEKSYIPSAMKQRIALANNKSCIFLFTFSPTGWKYFKFLQVFLGVMDGHQPLFPFTNWPFSANLRAIKYRQHNAAVLMNAPKDRLLVYSVKEGWEPLCNFLNLPIPNRPLPHKNHGATIYDDRVKNDPTFQKMKREAFVIVSLIFCFMAACVSYFL